MRPHLRPGVIRSRVSTVAGDVGAELRDLAKLARERPILIVGGALGLLLLAAVVSRQGAGDDEPIEDVAAEPDPITGDQGGTLDFGAGYGLPTYSGGSGTGYDPLTSDPATGTPTVDYTPDGCPLPKPAIPSGLSGKGDWTCSGGAWVWKSKGTGAPTSSAPKGPRITIRKGSRFIHYRLDKGRLRGEQRTAERTVTWRTSSTPERKRTYGGSTIRVVQLKSGPLSGRWVSIGAGSWYPS